MDKHTDLLNLTKQMQPLKHILQLLVQYARIENHRSQPSVTRFIQSTIGGFNSHLTQSTRKKITQKALGCFDRYVARTASLSFSGICIIN